MRDVIWKKKKLPSGKEVEVVFWSGESFVSQAGLLALGDFVRSSESVAIGSRHGISVKALSLAVGDAIRSEYADADAIRSAQLQIAVKDVDALVQLTTPKTKAEVATRSAFLFALPLPDPNAVALKKERQEYALAERRRIATSKGQTLPGRR